MADDKKAKRRLQNVEAAKKSYETKKKERNELQEKNTHLVAEQMTLLRDKSRLEDQVQLYSRLLTALEHTCSLDDQLPDCVIVAGCSEGHVSEVSSEYTNIPAHHGGVHSTHDVIDHHREADYSYHDVADLDVVHYNTHDVADHRGVHCIAHDVHSNGFIDQSETVEAVKNLQHHSNVALDLSSKAPIAHNAPSRGSTELSGRDEPYDVDDGLNIGATQEVEHTTRRRRNRRQTGSIPDQHSVVKRNRRDRLSPNNSCARSLLDSKRGSQLACDNGRRFSIQ